MEPSLFTYGESLPDQVDRIARLSEAQLDLLSDIREIYRDRAALEREYAAKLQVLAKKTLEKKSKKVASAVLGDEPTKDWNEDTLNQSTLVNMYNKIIGSTVNVAQDHINLSDSLSTQVVDVLKALEIKYEDNGKKQAQFYQKLLTDRDRVYNERLKSKQKYDEECEELETYRQKQDRAQDDKHADRAAKQYEQQQTDVMNAKNVFLIATRVANKTKTRFYTEDLVTLENQYQHLQTHFIAKFSSTLHHAQALQLTHQDSLKNHISSVEMSLNEIDTKKDQELFIEHNVRPFTSPIDWMFEPCTSHYDTGDMSVEPTAKIYLQNKLSKCRSKMQDLLPLLDAKRNEATQLSKVITAYTQNQSLGKVDEVMEDYLDAQHQASLYENSKTILEAEIDTITTALAGDEGSQSPHSFKSSSFTIPTECGYCGSSIWGLSKQGKTCKLCGLSVHSKCELKVPAECTGSRGSRHKASDSLSRTASVLSRTTSKASSVAATPISTPSSFAQTDLQTQNEEEYPKARVMFDFTPTSPFELAVREGTTVHVLEEDDGSGWVKVADRAGEKGLVPATYIESSDSHAITPTEAPAPGHAQGSGKYVRGIYDYQAQGPDELSIQKGGSIELTSGPTGGEHYADGWWEGININGQKGIFPSNYVELVSTIP